MLTTLPKLADRAFVLGFLLPSLIFMVALLALFGDRATIGALLQPPKQDAATAVLVLAAGAWLVAVFMLELNHWLYRVLEGYLPPFRWLRRRRRHYALRIVRTRRAAARLWGAEGGAAKARFRALMLQCASLPARSSDALPTAFGNAIKAFEIYPREVYGADGVSLWLRLAAVTPKPLMEAASDARAQVDFMVNTTFFAAIIAVLAASVGGGEDPRTDGDVIGDGQRRSTVWLGNGKGGMGVDGPLMASVGPGPVIAATCTGRV